MSSTDTLVADPGVIEGRQRPVQADLVAVLEAVYPCVTGFMPIKLACLPSVVQAANERT